MTIQLQTAFTRHSTVYSQPRSARVQQSSPQSCSRQDRGLCTDVDRHAKRTYSTHGWQSGPDCQRLTTVRCLSVQQTSHADQTLDHESRQTPVNHSRQTDDNSRWMGRQTLMRQQYQHPCHAGWDNWIMIDCSRWTVTWLASWCLQPAMSRRYQINDIAHLWA